MRMPVLLLVLATLAACVRTEPAAVPRVLILGFDGLDPSLLDRFLAAGELPHFAALAREGSYRRLQTTIPPQSPVAWSTFITGLDPGGHGIYDFIHRDPSPPGPSAILPYLSTSRVEEPDHRLTFGRYALPLGRGRTELLRHGEAFWNRLRDAGIPATVLKIPANFPPEESEARTLSDMGVPDIRGTYGTFLFYSSDPADGPDRDVPGGIVHRVAVRDGHVEARIPGPENAYLRARSRSAREFHVFVDPASDAVKIEIGTEQIVLEAGEWTGWVPLSFDLVPGMVSVPAMVRFHLAAVRPHFRLYVSPANMDPHMPALPISTPPDYAADLAREIGPFYTQGLPEDTAALTAGLLDDAGFLRLAADIHEERMRLFEFELARFRSGLLFAYFGGADQVSHMFWRTLDHDPASASAVLATYRRLDRVLARTREAIRGEDVTLIVMSDHGFAPFTRAVHLNAWLRDQGFLALRDGVRAGKEIFDGVDWSRTRAYGLGLNGLYLNQRGRERFGLVSPEDRERLLAEITARLLAWRDPQDGGPVVASMYRREEVYRETHRAIAPDLIVGYARGYRVSNQSALGEVMERPLENNTKKWSGDHSIAADLVPGVLLSNRELRDGEIDLEDFAPTVLEAFGLAVSAEMRGMPFLR